MIVTTIPKNTKKMCSIVSPVFLNSSWRFWLSLNQSGSLKLGHVLSLKKSSSKLGCPIFHYNDFCAQLFDNNQQQIALCFHAVRTKLYTLSFRSTENSWIVLLAIHRMFWDRFVFASDTLPTTQRPLLARSLHWLFWAVRKIDSNTEWVTSTGSETTQIKLKHKLHVCKCSACRRSSMYW